MSFLQTRPRERLVSRRKAVLDQQERRVTTARNAGGLKDQGDSLPPQKRNFSYRP